MRKTDIERLNYVGSVLLQKFVNVLATGGTEDKDEDYRHEDIWLSALTGIYNVEVKTISPKFRLCDNPRWSGLTPDLKTERLTMLNAEVAGDTTRGKYYDILRDRTYVCYLLPDCLVWFTPETLKAATAGFFNYRTFNSSERLWLPTNYNETWQLKAAILLDKGFRIDCNPPKELFNMGYEKHGNN